MPSSGRWAAAPLDENLLRSGAMATPSRKAPSPLEPREATRGTILWTIAVVLLVVLVAAVLIVARQAVLLLYVSGLLAIGMSPAIQWVERRTLIPVGGPRLPRWLAILLIYLAMIGVVTGIALLVLPALVQQAQQFLANLPDLLRRAQTWLVERGVLTETLSMSEIVEQAPVGGDTLNSVILTVWSVVGGLFGVFTILVLTFYLLLEAERIADGILRLVPRDRREVVRSAAKEVRFKVSAWLNGQLILGAIIGSSSALVLGLLGVPYYFVLAVLSAIGELIPYLGPILAGIPAVLMAATVSWQLAAGVVAFFFVQQLVENYLLVPRIMQHQVGISPVGVIVALLIGGSLLGVVGAILAVPTAAIIQVVVQDLLLEDGGS